MPHSDTDSKRVGVTINRPGYLSPERRGVMYGGTHRPGARMDLLRHADVMDAELAALRAEGEKFADEAEKDAAEILALRDKLAEANREVVRLGVVRDGLIGASDRLEAELERVTTERDDAYALIRHYADTDPEVALAERMRPVVEAADAAVDADRQMYHGTAEHAEANMEATFTALYDAVDAYRVATSEQEADDA